MHRQVPPVALLVTQHVTDYDKWKMAFDDHVAARIAASCLGHHINRGMDDPNHVFVYCPATDANKVKAFLESADLQEVMDGAGVEGEPTVTMMMPTSANFIADQKLPGMIVRHMVEDYDKWRAAYDAFDSERRSGGIVGDAVNQVLGNRNEVIVYHQAKDVDALRTLVNSPRLKEVMRNAGVVGQPEIQLVEVDDFSDY